MTTIELDRQSVRSGVFGQTVVWVAIADVGPVAAALTTSDVLHARADIDAVISAGISGAFLGSGLSVGDVAVATLVHHADLGVEVDGGFVPARELDWPYGSFTCDAELVELAVAAGATAGELLTTTRQSTSADRIAQLRKLWPNALAEAMEGAGVASAAARFDLPMTEVRAISNMVGPRTVYPWDKPTALDALARFFAYDRDNSGKF